MLIACKYEEIWPPLIKDYIHMCDHAYDKNNIIAMELDMLEKLDFNIDFNFISGFTFDFSFSLTTSSCRIDRRKQYDSSPTFLPWPAGGGPRG